MEYMDSARNCCVLKDGESINAAEECRRLASENRAMKKRCTAIAQRFAKVFVLAEDLSNYLRSGK